VGKVLGRLLIVGYIAGYFSYLGGVGYLAWHTEATFLTWWTRLLYEVMYAFAWPVWLALNLFPGWL
jgi:hypothetical protein